MSHNDLVLLQTSVSKKRGRLCANEETCEDLWYGHAENLRGMKAVYMYAWARRFSNLHNVVTHEKFMSI